MQLPSAPLPPACLLQVAVKVLLAFEGSQPEEQAEAGLLSLSSPLLASIKREASLLASMRHPCVVNFIGIVPFPPALVTGECCRQLHAGCACDPAL